MVISEDITREADRQVKRLLLLNHVKACPSHHCHCDDLKILWKHAKNCEVFPCAIENCHSIRNLEAHFLKCKETSCPVCTKVRLANTEKTVIKGYLWKVGNISRIWIKRFYVIHKSCIFYYHDDPEKLIDKKPKGIIFLSGSRIQPITTKRYGFEYYGFELLHQHFCIGSDDPYKRRILYCKNSEEMNMWIETLGKSAHMKVIEDEYQIGENLDHGRFTTRKECFHKESEERCIVAIIDKTMIEETYEKDQIKSEISILSLLDHPNILAIKVIYENEKHLFIVTRSLTGGELFDRIVGSPRFKEPKALKLIRPILLAVAYMHELGIVHGDLKPENILCGEEIEDLAISNFGSSKILSPNEKIKDIIGGTLGYAAPEVLMNQGYSFTADLWSVGVILFLVLCGKLPFDGNDKDEIIKNTIEGSINVDDPIWLRLSYESQDLITKLLNKNPVERYSAREALNHPFIKGYYKMLTKMKD